MMDPTIRHWFKDFHDHSTGTECDLDEFLQSATWLRTRCYRQVWTQAPRLCGCNICSGKLTHRHCHHQDRVQWRRIRQEMLKTWATEAEDFDTYVPHGSLMWAW